MSRTRPTAVDIQAALAPLPVLRNRGPQTPGPEKEAAFARLARTHNGAVFAGSFQGQSDWERHRHGDELVQILAGGTQLTILTDEGPTVLEMKAGMLVVVPQGCWHKFDAPDGVTVLTMTPQPTDHSTAEDPTQARSDRRTCHPGRSEGPPVQGSDDRDQGSDGVHRSL